MFSHPAFLWGLLALGIPILVHLLHFRRPQVLAFSHLRFLLQVQQVVRQRLRLHEYLVLALRLLLLFCLVMAFAGLGCQQQQGSRAVLVLVDDSPSMTQLDAYGQRLQQAREQARILLRSLDAADAVLVLPTSRLQAGLSFGTAAQAARQLEQIQPGYRQPTLAQVLAQVPDLLASAPAGTRQQVYVLSDFQQAAMLQDSVAFPADLAAEIVLVPIPRGEAAGNVGIANVAWDETLPAPGSPLRLQVRVQNYGSTAVQNLALRVRLGNAVVAADAVSLAAGAATTRQLVLTPPVSAEMWMPGQVELQTGDAGFDNQRWFSLPIPQPVAVQLVTPRPYPQLSVLFGDILPQTEVRSFQGLALDPGVQVVVWAEQPMGEAELAKLRPFLAQGGSLILFPTADSLAAAPELHRALGLGTWQGWNNRQPRLGLVPEWQHPLFRNLLAKAPAAGQPLEQLTDAGFWRYQPAPGAEVLLQANNQPVLVAQTYGRGRILTWTVPLTGRVPLWDAAFFAPLMYRSVQFLTRNADPVLAYSLGDAMPVIVPEAQSNVPVRLVPADSTITAGIVPEQQSLPEGLRIGLRRGVERPGNYQVLEGDRRIRWVSLNLPEAESRLDASDAGALSKWLDSTGVTGTVLQPGPGQVQAQVQSAERQSWRWWVLAALLCLLGESAVHAWFRRGQAKLDI